MLYQYWVPEMERHRRRSSHHVATFLPLFLTIFLLLPSAQAENKTDPTANQNLSPIQGWRSAEYCLQNTSRSCPEKYWLTDSGWLNVSYDDGVGFCAAGGCADHTRAVLLCIHHVKREYWFRNHASVKDLNETINRGCAQGFTGASLTSSGYRSNSAPIFGALSAAALMFIAFF